MNTIKCFSSEAMTPLLTWRNPQGAEEAWFQNGSNQQIDNYWIYCGKVVTTEIALCLLTTTSLIEAISYSLFYKISSNLLPTDEERDLRLKSLFESATNTLFWASRDAVFYNIFCTNVLTSEASDEALFDDFESVQLREGVLTSIPNRERRSFIEVLATNPIKSLSSRAMTQLLTWRNPQGAEETWFRDGATQQIDNYWVHSGKVVVTEIALCLLAITAAVEMVAYAFLTAITLFFLLSLDGKEAFLDKKYILTLCRVESSLYTVLRAIRNALFYNIACTNVLTQESSEISLFKDSESVGLRDDGSLFPIRPANAHSLQQLIIRMEQHIHLVQRLLQLRQLRQLLLQQNSHLVQQQIIQLQQLSAPLQTVLADLSGTLDRPESIDQGANFILDLVLADADEVTIECFLSIDNNMFLFLPARAIYIYVAGAKKDEVVVPDFFKGTTRESILELRKKLGELASRKEFEKFASDWMAFLSKPEGSSSFEIQTEDQSTKDIFNALRTAASEESQGSLLPTKCYQKAIEIFNQRLEALRLASSKFITEAIVPEATPNTIDRFQEREQGALNFVFFNAIYIYAVGSKNKDEIPTFFNEASQKLISNLRNELKDPAVLAKVQRLTLRWTPLLQSDTYASEVEKRDRLRSEWQTFLLNKHASLLFASNLFNDNMSDPFVSRCLQKAET